MDEPTRFWKTYWRVFHVVAAAVLVALLRRQWSQVAVGLGGLAIGIKVGQRDPSGFKIVAYSEGVEQA